jgi:hypothetical protein
MHVLRKTGEGAAGERVMPQTPGLIRDSQHLSHTTELPATFIKDIPCASEENGFTHLSPHINMTTIINCVAGSLSG